MGEHPHQNTPLTVSSTEQKTKCSTYSVRDVYNAILVISFNSSRKEHELFKEREGIRIEEKNISQTKRIKGVYTKARAIIEI